MALPPQNVANFLLSQHYDLKRTFCNFSEEIFTFYLLKHRYTCCMFCDRWHAAIPAEFNSLLSDS